MVFKTKKDETEQAKTGGTIEVVGIDLVSPHPSNPRRGDVEAIRKSIREHGAYGVLVVQRSTGHIIKGNHTWQALKAEGYGEVRVEWKDVDDDEAIAILLDDNRSSELGHNDPDILMANLDELNRMGALDRSLYDAKYLDALVTAANKRDPENVEFEEIDESLPEEPAVTAGKAGRRVQAFVTCPKCGHEFEA